MRIFLIGMPGSGKSTVGRYLSETLSLPIIDLDKIIEEEAGISIAQIFQEQGEASFRELEKKALLHSINKFSEAVISTGGGAACFFDNLVQMNAAGTTIYIDVPLTTLIKRTATSSKRPLLQDNREEKIAELLNEREVYYKKAQIIFSTKGKDSLVVAKEISSIIIGN